MTALWATLKHGLYMWRALIAAAALAYPSLPFSLRGGRTCVQWVGAVRSLIFRVIIMMGRSTRLDDDLVDYLPGQPSVLVFLAPAKKQTFLSTTVYVLMVRSMSAGIPTFLVLMAVFLGVGPSLTLCARIHTPRKEKFVLLQARVVKAQYATGAKHYGMPLGPSTMALTLAWVTHFVPLARALTAVWNLTLVVYFVTSQAAATR
jgi:hypothetical protein